MRKFEYNLLPETSPFASFSFYLAILFSICLNFYCSDKSSEFIIFVISLFSRGLEGSTEIEILPALINGVSQEHELF